MPNERKTVIVTGASQGIGANLVKTFLERGYSVVANSRNITKSGAFAPSDKLALVDGNIGEIATAAKVVETAMTKFKTIDALVNNAGIFFAKPFTNYTADDFKALASHQPGRLHLHQPARYQTNGRSENRWKHRQHNDLSGRTSDRRSNCFGPDDHKRRDRRHHAKSRDGICKGWHSCKRGCARNRRYSDAQERSQGLPEVFVTAGAHRGCPGYRRRRALSD